MVRFNEAFTNARQAQAEIDARRREEMREKLIAENRAQFAEVFPRGFTAIPKGFQFPLENIPQVVSASVFATPNGGRSLVIDVQGEVPRKQGDLVQVHDSYYVDAKGRITGPTERDRRLVNVDAQVLLREVLSKCAEVMVGRWRQTGLRLNPEGEGGMPRAAVVEKSKTPAAKVQELDRVALLAKQEGILARATNDIEGFDGYRLYVFSTFAVMECDYNKNAAYVIDFDGEIPLSAKEIDAMGKEEFDAYLMTVPGASAITLSRIEKRQDDHVLRIVHQGNWQERLQVAIDIRRRKARAAQLARQQSAQNDTKAQAA